MSPLTKQGILEYPYTPRSTVHLEPGQFWSIPLSNGGFACGRVLQLLYRGGQRNRRLFLAGLLDWSGELYPTNDAIANAQLLDHGEVHIKAIIENQGQLHGLRPLEHDGIEIPLTLDQSPGTTCSLRRGYELLGLATERQQNELKIFSTWGYRVIRNLAEKHFSKEMGLSGCSGPEETDSKK